MNKNEYKIVNDDSEVSEIYNKKEDLIKLDIYDCFKVLNQKVSHLSDNNLLDKVESVMLNIDYTYVIDREINNLTESQILKQQDKKIGQMLLKNIEMSLIQMENILELQLEISNVFINEGIEFLGKIIKQHLKIETLKLNLNNTNLDDNSLKHIQQAIESISNVKNLELLLNNNNLQQNGIEYLLYSIKKLNNLQQLSLDLQNVREISGQFGEQFGQLINSLVFLKSIKLELSNVQLTINDIENLSQAISKSQLTELKLALCECQLDQTAFEKIIGNYSKLNSFHLDIQSNYTLKNIKILDQITFYQLQNLDINFRGLSLSQDQFIHFNYQLSKLNQLLHLQLNFSCIQNIQQSIVQLGESFNNLKQLQSLQLQLIDIGLDQKITDCFSQGLQKLTQLTLLKINLDQNNLNNIAINMINNSLQKLNQIKVLRITYQENSKVNKHSIDTFIQALKNLNSLEEITVSFSGLLIDTQQLKQFGETLVNKKLKFLDVDIYNHFHIKEGFIEFFNCISQIKSITDFNLNIDSNYIKNQLIIQSLSQCIAQLINLNKLQLNLLENQVTNESKNFLLEQILQIKSLREINLYFDNNSIYGKTFRNIERNLKKELQKKID